MELSEDFNIPTNEFQTSITRKLLESLPEEVAEQLLDYISTVPFIQNLISPDRKRAKDLPRDSEGKIIVDISNPHILEDMDYFRPAALFYKEHGCYTFLMPNKNPNSEFYRWFHEEKRRCRDGYVRQSDGEWIPGYLYFFLNYCPILVTVVDEESVSDTDGNSGRADRLRDFPFIFEGLYWRAHYLYQARQRGKHAVELAKRGAGKSFYLASMLAHNLLLGESSKKTSDLISILTAYTTEYLGDKDGTLSKLEPMLTFLSEHTEFPRLKTGTLKQMFWQMKYVDKNGNIKGNLNTVMGVSSKDDVDKLRGKRGMFYFEEFGNFPGLLSIYQTVRKGLEDGKFAFGQAYMIGCVCAGTKIWTNEGKLINIEDLKKEQGIIGYSKDTIIEGTINICNGITKEPITDIITPSEKECLRITLSNGNFLECSVDHPILFDRITSHRLESYKVSNKRERKHITYFKRADEFKIGDRVCECRKINIFGNDTLFDARLVGMLIGDGSYGYKSTPQFSSEDEELLNYVKDSYEWSLSATHVTKKNKRYEDIRIKGIAPKLREIGIYGQVMTLKRLPNNYEILTEEECKKLLSGLYDTDGTVYFKENNSIIGITQCNKEILKQIQVLWRKFGVIGSITKVLPNIREERKDKHEWYNLVISGRDNLLNVSKVLDLLVEHKNNNLNKIREYFEKYQSKTPSGIDSDFLVHKVIKIEHLGKRTVYNLTAGLSHTYLANNIITHNTANNKESNFSSAKILLYEPDLHRIYSLPNVFDKKAQGNDRFAFFFPAFINRAGCYNKDGVSDVIKALIEILKERFEKKYSNDPTTLLTAIAEDPITPAEAIIKVKDAFFPVASLNERLREINLQPRLLDDVYIGRLYQDRDGEVKFEPTNDIPIRSYGVENTTEGALEIYEMPQKGSDGKINPLRYVIGHDPVDNDQAESHSLSSTFVVDVFTDRIVAEYTGRHQFANDNYEVVRLLCLFYNAKCLFESNKKGIFAYFQMLQCTHLLANTPEYLREKQLVKYSAFGSNAYGVNANNSINNYANGLIRDWLNKKQMVVVKEDGQEIMREIPNLYFIRSKALLEELIGFDPYRNFDRIRALGMAMLYREERMVLTGGNPAAAANRKSGKGYLGNDDYFSRNYKQ